MSGELGRMDVLAQAVDVLAADPEQLLPARQMMAFTLGLHLLVVGGQGAREVVAAAVVAAGGAGVGVAEGVLNV